MPSRKVLIAVPGMRFGTASVTDPEVRIREGNTGYVRRYARLQCDCGNVYLAALARLFAGKQWSCRDCQNRRRRTRGGRIRPSKSGWVVELYVGYYPTRAQAEDHAARARVMLLPKDSPLTGV